MIIHSVSLSEIMNLKLKLCFSVLDGPDVCYWFIILGSLISFIPTFSFAVYKKIKDDQMTKLRSLTLTQWLQSKNYVEMEDSKKVNPYRF